nr:MAG TPA: hypothetical protein [Caudoviricetes sp.]
MSCVRAYRKNRSKLCLLFPNKKWRTLCKKNI